MIIIIISHSFSPIHYFSPPKMIFLLALDRNTCMFMNVGSAGYISLILLINASMCSILRFAEV